MVDIASVNKQGITFAPGEGARFFTDFKVCRVAQLARVDVDVLTGVERDVFPRSHLYSMISARGFKHCKEQCSFSGVVEALRLKQ